MKSPPKQCPSKPLENGRFLLSCKVVLRFLYLLASHKSSHKSSLAQAGLLGLTELNQPNKVRSRVLLK